jgi:hypothetical protein
MKTSNTTLRPHIEKQHLDLYMSLVKEKGWAIMLPTLVSQARSQTSRAAAGSEDGRPDTFSVTALHERLIKFIVVNDQVRSRHLFNI